VTDIYRSVDKRSSVVNTTELSVCGGDAALCQITLTTCYQSYHVLLLILMRRRILTLEYGQPLHMFLVELV